MYKIENPIAPDYLVELFNEKEIYYCLRSHDKFTLPNFDTETCGRNSLKYHDAKLWNNLPNKIKENKIGSLQLLCVFMNIDVMLITCYKQYINMTIGFKAMTQNV